MPAARDADPDYCATAVMDQQGGSHGGDRGEGAAAPEDIMCDVRALFREEEEEEGDGDGVVVYGPLTLTIAPKEGKAHTLLADQLFSPALLLAEHVERGLIDVSGRTVLELGAGCALPALLCAAHTPPGRAPPALVVAADFPDPALLAHLAANAARNRAAYAPRCAVRTRAYEWGAPPGALLDVARAHTRDPAHPPGYDVLLLSDLLHYTSSHAALLAALCALLARTAGARAHVAAGRYTPAAACAAFVAAAAAAGLVLEEGGGGGEGEGEGWLGALPVRGLSGAQLAVRKGMCRWWVGRWAPRALGGDAGAGGAAGAAV